MSRENVDWQFRTHTRLKKGKCHNKAQNIGTQTHLAYKFDETNLIREGLAQRLVGRETTCQYAVQEPTAAVAIAHATAPPAITIIRLCLNVKYAANGDAKAWTRARMKVKVPRADGDTPKAFPTCNFPIGPERYEDEANFNKNPNANNHNIFKFLLFERQAA